MRAIEARRGSEGTYEVDFDTTIRVQYQSTLIVFKGTKEVGRSTGDTDAARIRALVAKGF